jgi:hypothetical protein
VKEKIHKLLEHSGTFLFGMEYSNLFIYLSIYLFEEACVVEPTWCHNKGKRVGCPVGEPGRARLKCQKLRATIMAIPISH